MSVWQDMDIGTATGSYRVRLNILRNRHLAFRIGKGRNFSRQLIDQVSERLIGMKTDMPRPRTWLKWNIYPFRLIEQRRPVARSVT